MQRSGCKGQNCFWRGRFFHISEWLRQGFLLHTVHCQGMYVRLLGYTTNHNDRNVPPCRVQAYGPVKAKPALFRHHHVQGNKVWKCLFQAGLPFIAITGCAYRVALQGKQVFQKKPERNVVINNQNMWHGMAGCWLRPGPLLYPYGSHWPPGRQSAAQPVPRWNQFLPLLHSLHGCGGPLQ